MFNRLIEVLRVVSPSVATVVTPEVPSGWTPSPAAPPFPQEGEIAAALDAANELESEASLFEAKLPAPIPAPLAIAERLRDANALSTERRRAEAWLAYVSDRELVTWHEVLRDLASLREVWSFAVKANVAAAMPRLTEMLEVRRAVARRSASSRKRNQKAVKARPVLAAVAKPGEVTPKP